MAFVTEPDAPDFPTAAVAFRLHNADAAGFCNQEICSANSNGRMQKLLSQVDPRGFRQVFRSIAKVRQIQCAGEEFSYFMTVLV